MSTSQEEILDLLVKLVKKHSHPDSNVNKWDYFTNSAGKQCTYAQKVKHLFFKNDWEETREFLLSLKDKLGD